MSTNTLRKNATANPPAPARSLRAFSAKLAAEWDTERNGIPASEVSIGWKKNGWWTCPAGHHYQAWVQNRVHRGSGCTYCSGRKVLPGFNDIATTHPEAAALWHPTRNGALAARQFSRASGHVAWWLCGVCGFEWQNTVSNQLKRKYACLACHPEADNPPTKPRSAIAPKLPDVRPDLAAEWHPTRNGDLAAADVTRAARRRVWWRCSTCGNEWAAYIHNRVQRNSGCPICARAHRAETIRALKSSRAATTRFVPAQRSLQVVRPDVAARWHPTLNGDRTPANTYAHGRSRAWFLLPCGDTVRREVRSTCKGDSIWCPTHGRITP